LIRAYRTHASAVLCAFDLLELDGEDLRRHAIEKRKDLLAKLLKGSHLSIALNEHFDEDGAMVYRAACQLGRPGAFPSPSTIQVLQHWCLMWLRCMRSKQLRLFPQRDLSRNLAYPQSSQVIRLRVCGYSVKNLRGVQWLLTAAP
jgi:hypothetical protein